jgi:hypothetical protein
MDRFIRITTATVVVTSWAVIGYRHVYELVSAHGETGVTPASSPSPWMA